MTRLPMSRAAAALLRCLLARTDVSRDRILLSDVRSVDWQSLIFIGERHEMRFHIPGPGAESVFQRLTSGLSEAELSIPGQIVADIRAEREPCSGDGISVAIEALTIEE